MVASGVLCGLHAEAKIADRLPHVLVGCSAAKKQKAELLADYLIGKNVNRLISFGIAAGLSPDLVAGDILLGATVVSEQGAWEADGEWNMRLIDYLPCYQSVPIWGGDVLLETARDKFGCAVRSGCLAADMESHIVARAAVMAGIPFNVVRVVADTADVDLPPAALAPLLEDGRPDHGAVLSSLIKKPSQTFALMKLGAATRKALKGLKYAVSVISALEADKEG